MFRRSKLLILLTALILIPILLGMKPICLANKTGSDCPLSKGKHNLGPNPNPLHSLTSPNDSSPVILGSTLFVYEFLFPFDLPVISSILIPLNNPFLCIPLRC
jgi:hypothetical protein